MSDGKPKLVQMRGVMAMGVRIMEVEDKDYPIAILMENTKERRAMSAAFNPQQAYELGMRLVEEATKRGYILNG